GPARGRGRAARRPACRRGRRPARAGGQLAVALMEDAVRPATRLPALLHRQQLLRLTSDGWSRLLALPGEDATRQCLALWAAQGFPLVVTRQPAAGRDAI